ncbi:MAG: hypothetical protein JSS09_08020 [Verrucomicrobia bacterium]|nr:hypothetical protein [Verrucomicrobiota bacterium]
MTPISRCSVDISGPEGKVTIQSKDFESNQSFTEGVFNTLKGPFGLSEKDAKIFPAFCRMIRTDWMPNQLEYTKGPKKYTVLVEGDQNGLYMPCPKTLERLSRTVLRIEHNMSGRDEDRRFSFSSLQEFPDPMLQAFFNTDLSEVSLVNQYPEGRLPILTYRRA